MPEPRSPKACPASMCPLLRRTGGSPWTGEVAAPCPEHDDIEHDGCPWWAIACNVGGMHAEVDSAMRVAAVAVPIKSYDCPKADECSWQASAERHGYGDGLCAPRYALANGVDPRVCNF